MLALRKQCRVGKRSRCVYVFVFLNTSSTYARLFAPVSLTGRHVVSTPREGNVVILRLQKAANAEASAVLPETFELLHGWIFFSFY